MADLRDAYTAEALEITSEEGDESVFLVMGSSTPENDYPDAPVGTFYFKPNGFMARKLTATGTGQAIDWNEGAGGSGSSSQNLPFFLANGGQDDILLINGALPFFLSSGIPDPITLT